eukprot:3139128-Prymnesium_polylepis.2
MCVKCAASCPLHVTPVLPPSPTDRRRTRQRETATLPTSLRLFTTCRKLSDSPIRSATLLSAPGRNPFCLLSASPKRRRTSRLIEVNAMSCDTTAAPTSPPTAHRRGSSSSSLSSAGAPLSHEHDTLTSTLLPNLLTSTTSRP